MILISSSEMFKILVASSNPYSMSTYSFIIYIKNKFDKFEVSLLRS